VSGDEKAAVRPRGKLRLLTPTTPDLDRRPILVFWETTKACSLACRHCRASALPHPLPGELSHTQALDFLESLTGFGRPHPVLILTGGDVLMRPDLVELVAHTRQLGLPCAVSPSVTPLLTAAALDELRALGVKMASVSLDGASAAVHEGVRQVAGHFDSTVAALGLVRSRGMTLQVNTVVMRDTVEELPELARIVKQAGAGIWELFFLVQTGRGSELAELSPAENEDVCHFLFDASRYGFVVRTVEGPFFRRVVAQRLADPPGTDPRDAYGLGPLYERLSGRLQELLGEPEAAPRAQTKGTRDGKGILFVAHDGEVYPSGFLPLSLGNVAGESVVDLYRDHPMLRQIRAARFAGRCGVCEYAGLCGGSRARAYAAFGNALGEDPACSYRPQVTKARPECLRH
jgi:radical SAM protein